ncbi:MAG TPA: hypothetical protein VFA45_22705, partial [Actinomycetes bacterium]|nr:hypothetical protein [Actinomycetes bacterium]
MATAVGCVALRVTARAQVAQARRTAHGPVYELDTANTVTAARLRSQPGDVAVFLTNRYPKGWPDYLRFYQGYDPVVQAAPPIASDRLVYLS